jgi:hypothetical protein
MIRPILLLCAIAGLFLATHVVFGFATAYLVGYGAFALMAAVISATYFWLWSRRATPLALGMAFGWAGAASLIGWRWVFELTDRSDWMTENPLLFLCLSLYFVGALLHLQVIGRSFELSERTPVLAFLGTVFASMVVALLT